MSKAKTIALTNVNCENFSRQDLLDFINSKIGGNFSKVEQLCTGHAYCQILEMIFPYSIGLRRIKTEAKLEHEFIYNWRLLQTAFNKLNYDKTVPIERLIKGRFQDNFEFLQWFKKFYDTVNCGKENHANVPPVSANVAGKLDASAKSSPEHVVVDDDFLDAEVATFEELKHAIANAAYERDYYLNKMKCVEALIKNEANGKQAVLCERILKIIESDDVAAVEKEDVGNNISADSAALDM